MNLHRIASIEFNAPDSLQAVRGYHMDLAFRNTKGTLITVTLFADTLEPLTAFVLRLADFDGAKRTRRVLVGDVSSSIHDVVSAEVEMGEWVSFCIRNKHGDTTSIAAFPARNEDIA